MQAGTYFSSAATGAAQQDLRGGAVPHAAWSFSVGSVASSAAEHAVQSGGQGQAKVLAAGATTSARISIGNHMVQVYFMSTVSLDLIIR